ncbi:MAG: DUF4428 domain-containing protein [Erysipelotrichales bacterium]|nr:DUF4428 domain-containing protein [Erysipelotrichales bacterium]
MEEYLDNICPICGNERTLFGNRQAKDGIICRNCAKKLSPWLSEEDIAEITVEELKKHIAYREENLEKLDQFTETENTGAYEKLSYDKEHGWIIFSKRNNLKKENPDLIPVSAIGKSYRSVRRQAEGNGLVNVYYTVEVDSPYFRKVDFRVNPFPGIRKLSGEYNRALEETKAYDAFLQKIRQENPGEEEPLIRYEEYDYYDD